LLYKLKKCNFSRSIAITDVGLRFLTDGHSGASIQKLNISELTQVTDMTLLRISQKCHQLQSLDVSFCVNLSDAGFEMLPNCKNLTEVICRGTLLSNHGASLLGDMKKIDFLNFSECQLIADWEKVTRKINPIIDKVDFSVIKSLTNNGVKELAFNCRQLSHINIAGCIELNDLAVQYISGVCRYLYYINISGLPHVSKRSIRFLKKGCKRLNKLVMLYMQSVTFEDYEMAQRYFPIVEYNQDEPPKEWAESYAKNVKYFEYQEGLYGGGRPTATSQLLIPAVKAFHGNVMNTVKYKMRRTKSRTNLNDFEKLPPIEYEGMLTNERPETALGITGELLLRSKINNHLGPHNKNTRRIKRHSFDGVTIDILSKPPSKPLSDEPNVLPPTLLSRPISARTPSRRSERSQLQRPSSARTTV